MLCPDDEETGKPLEDAVVRAMLPVSPVCADQAMTRGVLLREAGSRGGPVSADVST